MSFSPSLLTENPIVGILRGFDEVTVRRAVEAAARGGLRNIEVTMNSPDVSGLIRMLRREVGGEMNVGAGTVCSTDDLEQALEAGAQFIVTPVVVPEVISECVEREVPVFPGAMTPTEIWTAWKLGASMVKVFPASRLGPEYIREVKGPLDQIELMPTGGVNFETLPEYVAAGASAFGVGSPLFARSRLESGDWGWVEAQSKRFVDTLASC